MFKDKYEDEFTLDTGPEPHVSEERIQEIMKYSMGEALDRNALIPPKPLELTDQDVDDLIVLREDW